MLTRKTVLLNKTEVTYGTAPSMDTDDALLIGNLDVDVDPTLIERDVFRDTISAYGSRVGKKIMTCSFDVELKGNGAQPTLLLPLEFDAVLKACALVVTEEVDRVEYDPTSAEGSMDSVSLRFNLDGIEYLMTGCYGNVSFNIVAGAFGVMTFNFTGLYNTPTDVVQVAGTYDTTQPPIVESVNLLIDSYDGCAETLTFDFNNEVSERPCMNAAEGLIGLRITNRGIAGTVDPEMVLVATKDFWTIFEDSTRIALSLTIGTAVGNKFTITMDNIQITNIGIGDRNGIRIYNIEFLATGDDDEWQLKAF